MRPVPVVFLRLAFSDQLSGQLATGFEVARRRRPGPETGTGTGMVAHTLPDLGGRVATRGALVLLDVHGAATATTAQRVRLVVALTKAGGTLGWEVVSIDLPVLFFPRSLSVAVHHDAAVPRPCRSSLSLFLCRLCRRGRCPRAPLTGDRS